MFHKTGQPKTTFQILYNVAWAGSLGGLALLAEERRRQLVFAQKLIDNSRKLQAYKTYKTVAPLSEFDLGEAWDANLPNLDALPENRNLAHNTFTNNEWRGRKRIIRPIPTSSPSFDSPKPSHAIKQTPLKKANHEASANATTPTSTTSHVPKYHGAQARYVKYLQDVIARHVINCLESSSRKHRESGLRELRTYFSATPTCMSQNMQNAISLAWKIPTCEMELILSLEVRRNMMQALDKSRKQHSQTVLNKDTVALDSSQHAGLSASLGQAGQVGAGQDTIAQDITFHLTSRNYREAFYAFMLLCDGPTRLLTKVAREAIEQLLNAFKDLSLFSVVEYMHEKILHTFNEWQLICEHFHSFFRSKSGNELDLSRDLLASVSDLPPQQILSNTLCMMTMWLIQNHHQEEAEQLVREAIHFECRHLSTNNKDSIAMTLFEKAIHNGSFEQVKTIHTWIISSLLDNDSDLSFMTMSLLKAFNHIPRLEAVGFYIHCIQKFPSILREMDSESHANCLSLSLKEYSDKGQCPVPDALASLFGHHLPTTVLDIYTRNGLTVQVRRMVNSIESSEPSLLLDKMRHVVTQLKEIITQTKAEVDGPEPSTQDSHEASLNAILDLLRCIASCAKSHSLVEIVEDSFNLGADCGRPDDLCLKNLLETDTSKQLPKELNQLLGKFDSGHIFSPTCFQLILHIVEKANKVDQDQFYSREFLDGVPRSISTALSEISGAKKRIIHTEIREGKLDGLISNLGDKAFFENMSRDSIIEIYKIFVQKGPVSRAREFMDMLPSTFWSDNFAKVATSHFRLISRVWKVTKNFALTEETFQSFSDTLPAHSQRTMDIYHRLIMTSLDAGQVGVAEQLIDDIRRRSGLPCDISAWIFQTYSHALANEWDAIHKQLDFLRRTDHWQTGTARAMATPCIDRIFFRYCKEHSAEQNVSFFSSLVEKIGANATQPMIRNVMGAVVRDENVLALDTCLDILKRNKLEKALNKRSTDQLLHRIAQSPYLKYSNRGEYLWNQIPQGSFTAYNDVWSKMMSMHVSPTPPATRAKTGRIYRGDDMVKVNERKMMVALRLKKPGTAVQIYRQSLRNGLPSQQVDLELAVRASLRANYGATEQANVIIEEAKQAGLNTEQASRTVRFHQLLQKASSSEKISELVFEHYEELAAAGASLNHHFTIAATQMMSERGDSQEAIRLVHSVNQSQWCAKKGLDLPVFTALIRAFAQAMHVQGVRWVTETVLASNLRIDVVFTRTLKDQRNKARRRAGLNSELKLVPPGQADTNEEIVTALDECLVQSRLRRIDQRQSSLAFVHRLAMHKTE